MERPRFAEKFRPGRFLMRAHAYFLAVLGTADLISNWSTWLGAVKDQVAKDGGAIGWIYLAWIAMISLVEVVKLKLNYDLRLIQYEKAQTRLRERSRRRSGSRGRP